MRRLWLALAVCLGLCASAHAQSTYSDVCSSDLPSDANGWSIFPAHVNGSDYYFSESDGNDSTGAGTIASPWQTPSKAITQADADNGKDDHFLFKKGDVWQGTSFAISGMNANGLSCAHPMVFGSYDPSQPGVVDPYGNFAITGISCTSGTVTVTTATQAWNTADNYQVVITKTLPGAYNGVWKASVSNSTTFAFSIGSCPGTATLLGIVTLDRPTIEPNASSGGACLPKPAVPYGDYMAFVGIRCYGYEVDPGNANYVGDSGVATLVGYYNVETPEHWLLFEDDKCDYMTLLCVDQTGSSTGGMTNYVSLRRNVITTYGNYISNVLRLNVYQNYSIEGGWSPVWSSPIAVTVTNGTPGILSQTPNPFFNNGSACSTVKFTGTTLPSGITSGTSYYVYDVSGSSYEIDSTSCAGANLVTLSGASSGVLSYWQGTPANGYAGAFPQSAIFLHDLYLQVYFPDPGVWNISLTENAFLFPSGTSCDCANQQNTFDNLWDGAPSAELVGKGPPGYQSNTLSNVTYNVFNKTAPYYNTPTISQIGQGIDYGNGSGPVIIDHNIIANASTAATTSVALKSSWASPGATLSYNTVCNMPSPGTTIANGTPVAMNVASLVPGSGYTVPTTNSQYLGTNNFAITGIGGYGISYWFVTVNPNTGKVVGALLNNTESTGYRVGDVISWASSQIGGTGSGAYVTVTSVGTIGNLITVDSQSVVGSVTPINGGSGYSGGTQVNQGSGGSGGTGTGMLWYISVNASGQLSAVYPFPNISPTNPYSVGEIVGFTGIKGGTLGSIAISTVVTDTQISPTIQLANCNGLGPGGSNPSTDLVGDYFASLAYGYGATVPAVLTNYSSANEQGLVAAAQLQQKGNWDVNLDAHHVNNYVRTQLNMTNPPGN